MNTLLLNVVCLIEKQAVTHGLSKSAVSTLAIIPPMRFRFDYIQPIVVCEDSIMLSHENTWIAALFH